MEAQAQRDIEKFLKMGHANPCWCSQHAKLTPTTPATCTTPATPEDEKDLAFSPGTKPEAQSEAQSEAELEEGPEAEPEAKSEAELEVPPVVVQYENFISRSGNEGLPDPAEQFQSIDYMDTEDEEWEVVSDKARHRRVRTSNSSPGDRIESDDDTQGTMGLSEESFSTDESSEWNFPGLFGESMTSSLGIWEELFPESSPSGSPTDATEWPSLQEAMELQRSRAGNARSAGSGKHKIA
jgi:hypothetical protein